MTNKMTFKLKNKITCNKKYIILNVMDFNDNYIKLNELKALNRLTCSMLITQSLHLGSICLSMQGQRIRNS